MTSKGASKMPKNLQECVYVLQDVAQNLSKCVQNLSSKNSCESPTPKGNSMSHANTTSNSNEYKTMMAPQDWEDVMRNQNFYIQSSRKPLSFENSSLDNNFENFPTDLTSTRRPAPNMNNCKNYNEQLSFYQTNNLNESNLNHAPNNSLRKVRSATLIGNLMGMSRMPLCPMPMPSSSSKNAPKCTNQNNCAQKCPVNNTKRLCPSNYKSACPSKYNKSSFPDVDSYTSMYSNNQYWPQTNECQGKNPYVQLEQLILEIDDILQKTRCCTGLNEMQSSLKSSNMEPKNLCSNNTNSAEEMSYLVCKLNEFVSNQTNQMNQFENMIHGLQNTDANSQESDTGNDSFDDPCSNPFDDQWSDRLNKIIDIIIDGFSCVIKTLVQLDQLTKEQKKIKSECMQKECTFDNKLKKLQCNLIKTLEQIICTLQNNNENDEKGLKNASSLPNKKMSCCPVTCPSDSKVEIDGEGQTEEDSSKTIEISKRK